MTVDQIADARLVVLGPMAAQTRRSLGPLAWAALESLVADSRPINGVDISHTSVRQLAVRLGVAKNTAHRALASLQGVGLVDPVQSRSASGRYSSGGYRLTVPPSILSVSGMPPAGSPPLVASSLRPSSCGPPVPLARQLSLLPSS